MSMSRPDRVRKVLKLSPAHTVRMSKHQWRELRKQVRFLEGWTCGYGFVITPEGHRLERPKS